MFYSKNKRLFDLILSKINANTQKLENGNPVVASGNYMFVFNNQQVGSHNFEIISRDADALDFKSTEFIPLVDVQSIQVPFVEDNKRDDWEREFYVAIKMPKTRNAITNQMEIVFSENNPRYQAILETLENFSDNLTFVEDDYKYTFKVKEPTKVSVFTYNNTKYQVLAMTFNLTSLEKGFFGNETKLYFGEVDDGLFGETADYLLDFVEFNEIVGKTTRPISNVNDTEEAYEVDKRIWESTIVINFNGNLADMLLYKEKMAKYGLNNQYQIKITNKNLNTLVNENLDYTINVLVSNINITYQNNVVSQLTFKLERA